MSGEIIPKEVGDTLDLVTCNACGWVHVAVTRAYAEQQVKEFNEWFNKQPEETRELFGGKPSTIATYDRCFLCGPGATFRPFKEGDCPTGCAIQPTIYEEDDGKG